MRFVVYRTMYDTTRELTSFLSEEEAVAFCEAHNWEYLYDGIWWDLFYEEA